MAYQGMGVPIKLGKYGLYGIRNIDQIPPGGLIAAKNVRYRWGLLSKAGSLTKVDSNAITGTPDILAGYNWQPVSGTSRQIIAASDGSVYRSNGGDLDDSTIATGITFTDPVVFVEGGASTITITRKLFMFSAGVEPQILSADGTSMGSVTNKPTEWSGSGNPTTGILHDGRIYAFAGHTVYPSKVVDHTDFASGSIFQVAPGQGFEISAAISWGKTTMVVFKKPKGIYAVDTTNVVSAYIPYEEISTKVGCVGPLALDQVEDDIWFINQDGHIYSLQALGSERNYKQADITEALGLDRLLPGKIHYGSLKYSRLVYDPKRKEVWVMYRSSSGGLLDTGFVIDVSDMSNPRVAEETRGDYFEAMWFAEESNGKFELYCGGTGGLVYKANQTGYNVGTAAFEGRWRLPETDFGWYDERLNGKNKRIDMIEFKIRPTGNYNLSLNFYADGTTAGTATVNVGSSASALGTGQLGSFILGGSALVKHKVFVGAICETFGLEAVNSVADQGFEIEDIKIYMQPLGEEGEH